MRKAHNTQMFALRDPPPATMRLAGGRYELVRIFKHDFFAATCLYRLADGGANEGAAGGPFPKLVVKFCRTQGFCGLPGRWVGELLCDREQAIYEILTDVRGVPRWVDRIDRTSYAIQYIEGRPLDHPPGPPPGFFQRLRELFDAIHARGVGYCDANKLSNILISPDGEPFLVDYQISIRRRDDWPRPLRTIMRAIVDYVAEKDIYHLCKHKRHLSPQELTPEEDALSRRRRGPHLLHRKLTKPWRALRRRFLRRQYEKGRLVSPTADLEDHHQPEKATWRTQREAKQ